MGLIQARCHANDHTVLYESSRIVRSGVQYSYIRGLSVEIRGNLVQYGRRAAYSVLLAPRTHHPIVWQPTPATPRPLCVPLVRGTVVLSCLSSPILPPADSSLPTAHASPPLPSTCTPIRSSGLWVHQSNGAGCFQSPDLVLPLCLSGNRKSAPPLDHARLH